MKKRLISFALALALCLGLTLPALAASFEGSVLFSAHYSDIPEGHWSEKSVERAAALGLFQGIGGGKFGRGQPITRAAFVTALVRLFGWEEERPRRASFSDVTSERWFYGAVETALAHGAIAASDHAFRPTDNVTREEMAAMLVRGLGYTSLAGVASGYSAPFSDITTNKGFIIVAYDLGIVDGVGDGRFTPTGTATREQAAAMLVRVHDRLTARSTQLRELGSYRAVSVETPAAEAGAELPTTPLEPLTDLYGALRRMKNSGGDMAQAALLLSEGGVRTVVSDEDGAITGRDILTAQEVASLLGGSGVNTYYSARYESAYCIYQTGGNQTAVVWYQSEESLAAKLQLARLFGVTHYLLG